jgi:hypothetical protein
MDIPIDRRIERENCRTQDESHSKDILLKTADIEVPRQ